VAARRRFAAALFRDCGAKCGRSSFQPFSARSISTVAIARSGCALHWINPYRGGAVGALDAFLPPAAEAATSSLSRACRILHATQCLVEGGLVLVDELVALLLVPPVPPWACRPNPTDARYALVVGRAIEKFDPPLKVLQ